MLAKEDGGISREAFQSNVESGPVLFWKIELGCFLGLTCLDRPCDGAVMLEHVFKSFGGWR